MGDASIDIKRQIAARVGGAEYSTVPTAHIDDKSQGTAGSHVAAIEWKMLAKSEAIYALSVSGNYYVSTFVDTAADATGRRVSKPVVGCRLPIGAIVDATGDAAKELPGVS